MLFISVGAYPQEAANADSNVTLSGRWPNGPCDAVFVVGNYAYIGNGGAIDILDISYPATPERVGQIITPSVVWGIHVSGNYVYVADDWDGLRIIDITDPSNPTEVGFYDTGSWALGVYVSGNYAYMADGVNGLNILRNDLLLGVASGEVFPPGFALS